MKLMKKHKEVEALELKLRKSLEPSDKISVKAKLDKVKGKYEVACKKHKELYNDNKSKEVSNEKSMKYAFIVFRSAEGA